MQQPPPSDDVDLVVANSGDGEEKTTQGQTTVISVETVDLDSNRGDDEPGDGIDAGPGKTQGHPNYIYIYIYIV